MKEINSNKAPQAIGYYSQAIEHKGICYLSMQIGINEETGEVKESFLDQIKQIMQNITYVLKAGELDWQHVVRVSVYLDDMQNFTVMNKVYGQYVVEPYPAREVVAVKELPRGAKAGISITAIR